MKFDKRKAVILSLVFVLISISYLNYMVNKQSVIQTSSEFEKFEENELITMELENDTDNIVIEEKIGESKATSSIAMTEENNNVVDSMSSNIDGVVAVSNTNIEETLSKEKYNESNYFIQAKIDIELEREKTIEKFDDIINNEMVDEDSRKDAVKKKIALVESMNKEKIVESLIKGKGFEDTIVFITDESVYVTVKTDELSKADIAKILDITSRETNALIDDIKIQKK